MRKIAIIVLLVLAGFTTTLNSFKVEAALLQCTDPTDCPLSDGTICLKDCVCPSPIIIDTSGKGFHLTSAQNGVWFDITGTGDPIRIAWTDADAENAFLALDRDGNGRIDNGKELFGNYTDQPASPTRNGFLALAEFDRVENGGNGDGVIKEKDAIFSSLRLWVDANHDGMSQSNELYTLPTLGVLSINLHYRVASHKDKFGNLFRFRALINRLNQDEDTPGPGPIAYDVFFTTALSKLARSQ